MSDKTWQMDAETCTKCGATVMACGEGVSLHTTAEPYICPRCTRQAANPLSDAPEDADHDG